MCRHAWPMTCSDIRLSVRVFVGETISKLLDWVKTRLGQHGPKPCKSLSRRKKQRKVEFHFCPLDLGHQSSLIPCVTYQSRVFRQDQKVQYWLLNSQACSPVSPDHTCQCLIINNQQAITLGLSLRITLTTIREGRQLYSFTCATPDVTSSSGVDSLIYLFSTMLFSSYFELFLQIV